MKRKDFFKTILSSGAVILLPVIGWTKEKYITDCKDCRRDFECCKVFVISLYGKEPEIIKKLAKKQDKKVHVDFDKDRKCHVIRERLCPFYNEKKPLGKNCGIYKWRPFGCRIYHCYDFGFSNKKLEKIEAFHREDWNFGSKVKLSDI